MAEPEPAALPERRGDPAADDDAAERQVAAVTPLAKVIMSGRTPKRSAANQVPRRPNAAMTQSTTNSAPARSHSAATRLEVAGRGQVQAAGADHGLDEDRRDALRADARDLRLERLERVVRDVARVRVERTHALRLAGMPPIAVPRPWVPW